MNTMEQTAALRAETPALYPARPQNARGRAFVTNGRDGMQNENTAETATAQAVAYLRINKEAIGSAEATAWQIDRQRARCEEVARQHGLTIVEVYADTTGAVGIGQRPELARLLGELPNTRARYVITGDVARISRNVRDLVAVERRLMQADAELLVWGEDPVHAHLRRRMVSVVCGSGVRRTNHPEEGGQA